MKKYLIITQVSTETQTSILISDKVYDSFEDAQNSLSKKNDEFEHYKMCGYSVSSAFTEIDIATNQTITSVYRS